MSDFFAPPPGQGGQGPANPLQSGAQAPAPGMPGYSWNVHQQVRAEVAAAAPPAVPLSAGTVVVAVAGLGSLLMVLGGWAPWIRLSVGGFGSQTLGGLHHGFRGGYLLGMGIAGVLAAGTVLANPGNRQVRLVCAGALVGLGAVGLGIAIHEWTTIADQVRRANALFSSFRSYLATQPGGSDSLGGFDLQIHVAKAWGLTVSGLASVITGLAGVYLFLVRADDR